MKPVSRKQLIPLIKIIHPDLFAHHTSPAFKVAQNANLNCMQSLQQIWDCLDPLVHDLTSESASSARKKSIESESFEIRKPLGKKYDLSFYFTRSEIEKESDSNVPKLSLYKIPYKFASPENLTSRCTISFKELLPSVKKMLQHHDNIFASAGLQPTWQSVSFDSNPTVQNDENLATIEMMIFDKMVSASSRVAKLSSYASKDFSSLLSNSNKQRKTGKLHTFRDLPDEVDFFLRNNNVFFQSVSEDEQVKILNKFHEFFVLFGGVMNFDLTLWNQTVFFVFSSSHSISTVSRATPSFNKKNNINSTSTSMMAGGDCYETHSEELKGGRYSCETLRSSSSSSKRYIITLPPAFNSSALLKFLSVRLPLTNSFATYTIAPIPY